MMACEICHDTTGPFEIIEHKGRCKLACENCAKKKKKKQSRERKANNYYEYSMKR